MNSLLTILQSSRVNIYIGVILATIWGFFAYAHMLKFQMTHEWSLLLFFFAETLTATMYIFRSEPKTVSVVPIDWLIAIAGTFAPFFFRPTTWGVLPWASIAIIVGATFQILGVASLNRSFALVAAKREIKTGWMYRIVRHPIYASYCLTFTGYVLTNTSTANIIVYVITIGFLCARIFREETHLALDPMYREYMHDVRYRLIPYIF